MADTTDSKSLVKKGNKVGAQTNPKLTTSALRNAAGGVMKGAGKLLFNTPAVIATDILASKETGTDQFGRFVDTPEGFMKAERDREVAEYYMEYGAIPEDVDWSENGVNYPAIENMIESKMKQERMAQLIRAEGGQTDVTPEQQQKATNKNKFMDDSHQGAGGGYNPASYTGRGGG